MVFDLNKEYCVYKCEQEMQKLRFTGMQNLNSFTIITIPPLSELKINFLILKERFSGFFFCITWSPNKNTFYVGAKDITIEIYIELSNANFFFLTKNKLILLKRNSWNLRRF